MEKHDEIVALVRRAGEKLLEFWPGSAQAKELQTETKADGSRVTAADIASNEILVSGLKSLFPGDGIFSEEGDLTEELYSKDRVWIIDPLDGTHPFIDGRDDFSILVGLTVKGRAVAGFMHFPAKGLFAWAANGEGAFLDGEKLKVSSSSSLRKHSLYQRNLDLEGLISVYPEPMDSGMAFLELCRGRFDGIALNMERFGEYDIAAPVVIIAESGGVVSDENGKPIKFMERKRGYKTLVASNKRVHNELITLL